MNIERSQAPRSQAIKAASVAWVLCGSVTATAWGADVEWPVYGGNLGFNRYSPASLINKKSVAGLHVLWTRPAVDEATAQKYPGMHAGRYFKSTPIMIGGVLYAPNGVGLAEAFDAKTGKTLWVQEPPGTSRSDLAGMPTRGLAYWHDGSDRRIINARGGYLYELDAASGKSIPAFGENGRVAINPNKAGGSRRGGTSGGPLVVGDVIVQGTGGAGGDMATRKKGDPSVIRGFDVRSGKILWEFSPMPGPEDPARSSWGAGSAEIAGYMATWGQLSADEKLGYVYIPLGGPGPPGFGGWRPGDNLYGASLVALDAKTGKKIWHFQAVHHDLWDWDLAPPPVLGTITVDGHRIDAVMQSGKVPLLYTLDRRTGKPVWPIIERPVPASDVPGEATSPTQPIPTKPPPLDRLGVTESELLDFTPELHAEAVAQIKKYHYGPMFVPPSIYVEGGNQGSLTIPPSDGSAGWNTGAFDPVNGVYYAMTITAVTSYGLVKANPPADVVYSIRDNDAAWNVLGPQGLPLIKPPYGRITAVDMNRGEILWSVANGDGPRNHPAIKHLNLPPLGLPGRVAVAVTPELVLAPEGSDAVLATDLYSGGGNKFRAFDKADGKVLKEITIPAGATGAPITYVADGKQYIVVALADSKHEPQWVALGL